MCEKAAKKNGVSYAPIQVYAVLALSAGALGNAEKLLFALGTHCLLYIFFIAAGVALILASIALFCTPSVVKTPIVESTGSWHQGLAFSMHLGVAALLLVLLYSLWFPASPLGPSQFQEIVQEASSIH